MTSADRAVHNIHLPVHTSTVIFEWQRLIHSIKNNILHVDDREELYRKMLAWSIQKEAYIDEAVCRRIDQIEKKPQ